MTNQAQDDISALSSLLFPRGVFDPHRLGDSRTADVLETAVQRFASAVRGSDVLHAAITGRTDGADPRIRAALELALADGTQLDDVRDVIDAYHPAGADSFGFDGSPMSFSAELLAALSDFEATFCADPDRLREVALELLLACVLDHPDEQDREFLAVLDCREAAEALRRRARLHTEPPPGLWDEESGRLRSEEFTADALAVLERAAGHAASLGYDRVLVPHCLLALLAESEGLADRVVRRQLPPRIGVVKAAEIIAAAFRLAERGTETVPRLHRDDTGVGLQDRLRTAQLDAVAWGAQQVDVPHLLASMLADPPERLAAVLHAEPLCLDLNRLRDQVRQAMLETRGAAPREVPYRLPSFLPPAEDLTWLARAGAISPACHVERYFDELCRALHRTTDRHVLVTGLPGSGRTTLVRELARRAALGEIPFLARRRFVRVDCQDVAPEHSETQLNGLISHVGGRTDVVLCVDGLGQLLTGPNGASHNLILRSALKAGRVQLVGILTSHDYDDVVSVDHELVELTTLVAVIEPDRPTALDMVRMAASDLAGRFSIAIEDAAIDRAVVLARDFLPRQRLPLSAVRVLHRACENLDYARSRLSGEQGSIGTEDVVLAAVELSGVPAGQLGGAVHESVDYEELLGGRVVGQPQAVRTVAHELQLIKTGLAEVSKGPGSVLLFAGLTGVGKTELAKAVADVYSASKRLQTYPMENFTEPHSVSAFLGPPPGYVGHERGGRLINELNADPYGVVLLDEAEKAHPEVLRPFLNLFDEGWIVDQRGVKAYGERAIFILTSNAGHEVISKMAGRFPAEEIEAAVLDRLRSLRTRHNELIFTPELLARIKRIVVFRPLDQQAMLGICRMRLSARRAQWLDKRGKDLVVTEGLISHAARLSYQRNEQAGGTEGGRIVEKMLSDLVDIPVTVATRKHNAEFQACARIDVRFVPSTQRTEVQFTGPDGEPAEAAR